MTIKYKILFISINNNNTTFLYLLEYRLFFYKTKQI